MRQGRRAIHVSLATLTVTIWGALAAVSLARGKTPEARGTTAAQSEPPSAADADTAVPGELLVRFEADADSRDRAQARRDARTKLEESLPTTDLELLRLKPRATLAQAEATLESDDSVLYAEPNFYRRAARTPNDASFGNLWGFDNHGQPLFGVTGTQDADIDAPEAWDVTTGDTGIGVAIVDSGLDLDHRDLASNVWANPGESGGGKETNRRDDDSNGLVDDSRGWDWVASDNDPEDANGHGTHVAGTIGARGDDGFGVAGIDWNARLMALRVLDDKGAGTLADVIQAYSYAGRKGARVVNASLGGGGYSRSEYDVIRGLPNLLFVVAAGNDGSNNDQSPGYPCAYDLSNVVCVAASDQHDRLASFSNFGATSVDLAAPGTNIFSSWPGGGHGFLNGTSMATPHVAGAAALLFSRNPSSSAGAAKSSLLQSVDHKASLSGMVATGDA
jgi:subtilisin family serine protease